MRSPFITLVHDIEPRLSCMILIASELIAPISISTIRNHFHSLIQRASALNSALDVDVAVVDWSVEIHTTGSPCNVMSVQVWDLRFETSLAQFASV